MAREVVVTPEMTALAKSMEKELTARAQAHLRKQRRKARAEVDCHVTVGSDGKASVSCGLTIKF